MDSCYTGLSDEEIADLIWEYYLRKQIPYIEQKNLEVGIMKEFGLSFLQKLPDNYIELLKKHELDDCLLKFYKTIPDESIELLKQRGLVTVECNSTARCWYFTFYSDRDEIKENIERYMRICGPKPLREEELMDKIKNVLSSNGPMTVSEIFQKVPESPPMQKLSCMLNRYVKDGTLERTTGNKCVRYNIKK